MSHVVKLTEVILDVAIPIVQGLVVTLQIGEVEVKSDAKSRRKLIVLAFSLVAWKQNVLAHVIVEHVVRLPLWVNVVLQVDLILEDKTSRSILELEIHRDVWVFNREHDCLVPNRISFPTHLGPWLH